MPTQNAVATLDVETQILPNLAGHDVALVAGLLVSLNDMIGRHAEWTLTDVKKERGPVSYDGFSTVFPDHPIKWCGQ